MGQVNDTNFGILIGFVVPGFLLYLGIWPWFPALLEWLSWSTTDFGTTIAGGVYALLASLGFGVVVSGLRYFVVDKSLQTLYSRGYRIGVDRPNLNWVELVGKETAFNMAVQSYYRFYQCYANTFVSGTLMALSFMASGALYPWSWPEIILGVLVYLLVSGLLLCSARNCLENYYSTGCDLLGRKKELDK